MIDSIHKIGYPPLVGKGGIPMTIVAAIRIEDYILIGADTTAGQVGFVGYATKLGNRNDMPIAWGFTGDLGVGREFSIWLRQYEWKEDIDWRKFRDIAAKELGRLNAEHIGFIRNSLAEPTDEDRAGVLVVGYINGHPEILEITGKGERYFLWEDAFAAMGSGEIHMKVVKATIDHLPVPITDALFWKMFDLAARLDPKSGPPVEGLKVTPEGIHPRD